VDVTPIEKKGMGAGGWVAVSLGVLLILGVGAAAYLYFATDVFDGMLGDGDGGSTTTSTATSDPGARSRLDAALAQLSSALDATTDGGLATASATFAGARDGYTQAEIRRTWGHDDITRIVVDGGTAALRFTVYCTPDELVFARGDDVFARSLGDEDDCLAVLRAEAQAATSDGFLRAGLDLLTIGPQDLQFIRASGGAAQTTGEYAHVDGHGYKVTIQDGRVSSIVMDDDDDKTTATYAWGAPTTLTIPEADGSLPAVVIVVRDGGSTSQPQFRLDTPHEGLPRDRFQVRLYTAGSDPAGGASPYRTFGLASGSQKQAGCGYTWLSQPDAILDDGDRFGLTTSSECDDDLSAYIVVVWDLEVGSPTQTETLPGGGALLTALVVAATVAIVRRAPKRP
jgi:hypothetical protein